MGTGVRASGHIPNRKVPKKTQKPAIVPKRLNPVPTCVYRPWLATINMHVKLCTTCAQVMRTQAMRELRYGWRARFEDALDLSLTPLAVFIRCGLYYAVKIRGSGGGLDVNRDKTTKRNPCSSQNSEYSELYQVDNPFQERGLEEK